MPSEPWNDHENDLIVGDYFAMLDAEIAGQPYSKAERRQSLLPLLRKRTESSVEFKHRNISAVLKGLGEDWIAGYRPAFNIQSSLEDAVMRWLARHPAWFERLPDKASPRAMRAVGEVLLGPPPTLSNQLPPQELEQMLRIAEKFDIATRDARNRVLGRAGEKCVVMRERAVLTAAGRDDLAARVRWVSDQDGDGLGYDVASFTVEGRSRLIEVKTTNGWDRTPFHITRNELEVAKDRRHEWCLFRLWNFSREPRAFELHPPLDAHVSLIATTFQANFH